MKALEEVVRHYTGIADLDNASLGKIARSLQRQTQQPNERNQPNNEGSSDSAGDDNDDEEFRIDPMSSTTAGKPLLDRCHLIYLI